MYLLKILEGKQLGTVYHFTYSDNLPNMLKQNKLSASTDVEYIDDIPMHYVSLTRSKSFGSDSGFNFDVRITLDGTKITDRYKFNYR